MKDENMLLEYYIGNYSFYSFLIDLFSRTTPDKTIITKEVNMAARIGLISTILLSIKESLVSKEAGYSSRIFTKELENSVDYIARKETNGYAIGNSHFSNASEVVAVIRNKIGHGDFITDFSNSKIIIEHNNTPISLNIIRLSTFVSSALKSFSKVNNSDTYERKYILNNKIETYRHASIKSKDEMLRFLHKFKKVKITLKRKDGSLIDENIKQLLELSITNNKDKSDYYTYYEKFKKLVAPEYDFDYREESIKNMQLDSLAEFLVNNTAIRDYASQVEIIGRELDRVVNGFDRFNPIAANLSNLIFLEIVYKNRTVNPSLISSEISKEYGNIYMNYDNLVASAIAMFNSLFSYGLDKFYENTNKFTAEACNGLDYSCLDLSKVHVNCIEIDTNKIQELENQKRGKGNEINNIQANIDKYTNSRDVLKTKHNQVALAKVENNLYELIQAKELTTAKLNQINSDLTIAKNYFNNNQTYLRNERIIEGIRNSISHGNFEVEAKTEDKNTQIFITFKDVYEGNLTFSARVELKDFALLIVNSSQIIREYFENKRGMTR